MPTIQTLSTFWRAVRATNTTDTSFPSRVPTQTAPAGTGGNASQTTASAVIDLCPINEGQHTQNSVLIAPYGTGSSGQTMGVRVFGWRQIVNDGNAPLWVPVDLCEFNVTLGTATGATGSVVTTAMVFATSLALVTGNQGVSVDLVSPGSNLIAHASVDLVGFQRLEIVFTNQSSCTDCNALVALL